MRKRLLFAAALAAAVAWPGAPEGPGWPGGPGSSGSGCAVAADWTRYTAADGLPSDTVTSVVADPFGGMWFGTTAGLCRFEDGAFTVYRSDPAQQRTLADDRIHAMAFEQGWGPELWIGTENGVSVMGIGPDAVTFATPYRSSGLPLVSDRVWAVAVDSGRTKWFGTDRGISLFDGNAWKQVDPGHISNPGVLSFGYDRNTGWNYVGTRGGGVSRVRIDSLDGVTSASPFDYAWASLPSDTIHSVFIEPNGDQWFGTDRGLAAHQGTRTKLNWEFFNRDSGMADDFIEAVFRDSRGRLWVGTHAGVSVFDGTAWANFGPSDGLAGRVVNAVTEGRDGSIWVAAAGGVSRLAPAASVNGAGAGTFAGFRLANAYPNPFNPAVSVRFTVTGPAAVFAEALDVSGRRAAVLENRHFEPGAHRLDWTPAAGTPAGVYVLRVTFTGPSGAAVRSVKAVLAK